MKTKYSLELEAVVIEYERKSDDDLATLSILFPNADYGFVSPARESIRVDEAERIIEICTAFIKDSNGN